MKTNVAIVLLTAAFLTNGCAIMSILPPPNIEVGVEENISSRVSGSSLVLVNATDLKLFAMIGSRPWGSAKPGGGWIIKYPLTGMMYTGFQEDFEVQTIEEPILGASQNFWVDPYSRKEIWFVKRDGNRLYFTKQ